MTRNGFSLVELLAAMVAGSLLLIGVGWAVAGVTRDYRRTGDEVVSPLIKATGIIVATVERSTIKDDAAEPSDPLQLVVIGSGPQSLRSSDAIETRYILMPAATGQRLVASYRGADGAAIAGVPADQTVLLDDLTDASFVYGRRTGVNAGIIWVGMAGTWRGRPFRVAARPLLTSNGACRFDPVSLICRT